MLQRLRNRLFGAPPPNHAKTSYAQCGEDLIVDFILQQLGIDKPWYIDVGAHHPAYLNNTYLFYLRGARGVNVEPDPALLMAFLDVRPDDTNLGVGVGGEAGTAELLVFNEPTLNTFSEEEAAHAHAEHPGYFVTNRVPVPIRTIDSIIQEHAPPTGIDFMSIDVEGLDETIIRSMNPDGPMPKVLCVETITFSAKRAGEKRKDLIDLVLSRGYSVHADTHINTLFVQRGLWR
ncbi:MAG: FkbM family methyltransferase [Flavobacteriales bacterium]|nr:FkbM family methyltransferase [Flavobacteriales bacterium]